jgi:hypothetical protein
MKRDFVEDLTTTVERASALLFAMPSRLTSRRPSPDRWSPVEILGHLIDSASHNHHRFVRACLSEHLRFEGYEQDAWVTAQAYQSAGWDEIVTLWRALNLHLAHVMERTPDPCLTRPRPDHNLDLIAWEPAPREEPATLEYLMRDYVGHLKHHLRQIHPDLSDPPRHQRENRREP